MKNSKEYSAKFSAQVKKLKKQSLPADMADPVDVLVYTQLLWESATPVADVAWEKLIAARIDWHEVRVSTPREIAAMCGDKSALAEDRGGRLKAMLNHLYQRHHEVTMTPEFEQGKRDLREAIEALDGMTPFVSARWLMLCGDIGGVPVDDQLRWMLANVGCVDGTASTEEVAAWVSRQVKSEDSAAVHATLQAWVNGQSDRVAKQRAKEAQAAAKVAKKDRGDALSQRAVAQETAAVKRAEAAARAAARKAAAELAELEKAQAAASIRVVTTKSTAKVNTPVKKKTPAKKKASAKKKTPAKKKASAKKKTPVKKKATAKKKTPVKKKATAKKKTPAKKKAPAKKKTPVKKKAPAKKKAAAKKKSRR